MFQKMSVNIFCRCDGSGWAGSPIGAPSELGRLRLLAGPGLRPSWETNEQGLGVASNGIFWHSRLSTQRCHFLWDSPWTSLQFKVPSPRWASFMPCVQHFCGLPTVTLSLRHWAWASRAAEKWLFVQNRAPEVMFSKPSKCKCAPCLLLAHSCTRQIPAVKIFWWEASAAASFTDVGIHWAQFFEGHCRLLFIKLLYTWYIHIRQMGWEKTEVNKWCAVSQRL